MELYEGQVKDLVFDLNQAKVLASPAASEVFWAFRAVEAVSVRQIAKFIGKSAPAVHAHIPTLINAKLILKVGEQKRKSRIENLYVRAGVHCIDQGLPATPEYREYRKKAFAASMRRITREKNLTYDLADSIQRMDDLSEHRRVTLRLTEEETLKFRAEILQVINKYRSEPPDPKKLHLQAVFIFQPTFDQLNEWQETHKSKRPRKRTSP